MKNGEIIVSMTTWPPRAESAIQAMRSLVTQQHSDPVRFVLVLSEEEWDMDFMCAKRDTYDVIDAMKELGVEIIWDKNNIKSHKKLIPTLERYPGHPILVVDDDVEQRNGWLQTFIDDHRKHPSDIIYGNSSSKVEFYNGKIVEGMQQRGMFTKPGQVTYNEKPANGAAGTLYPSGTFTDPLFFNRRLFMRLCPTSDETWQWAWCVMQGKTYRCLSSHNVPLPLKADQQHALFNTNIARYTAYHNAIAEKFPAYREALKKRILDKAKAKQKEL